ncbi:hypothetical protein [Cystobacter fuscus]|uniref:hypothetical protein n=1 Tax=Cystobacter fuscus TaxID=43 RepID=UPI0037BE7A58
MEKEAPGVLAAPLTDFFRLHAMRWELDGGSQDIRSWGVEAFHRDATQLLAERGHLRLYTRQVREVAKRLLPQDAVERVRRLRRRLSAVRG